MKRTGEPFLRRPKHEHGDSILDLKPIICELKSLVSCMYIHLSTIEIDLSETIDILVTEARRAAIAFRHHQEANYDSLPCVPVKLLVLQDKMNSIKNSFIKLIDQVSREEQNSIKVLKFAKENRHLAVPF